MSGISLLFDTNAVSVNQVGGCGTHIFYGAAIHHILECGCRFVATSFVSSVGARVIAGAVRPSVRVISVAGLLVLSVASIS